MTLQQFLTAHQFTPYAERPYLTPHVYPCYIRLHPTTQRDSAPKEWLLVVGYPNPGPGRRRWFLQSESPTGRVGSTTTMPLSALHALLITYRLTQDHEACFPKSHWPYPRTKKTKRTHP